MRSQADARVLPEDFDNLQQWEKNWVKAFNASKCEVITSCPHGVKEHSYKTLVRPIIEYASTVWDPHTQTNISQI